MSNKEIRLRDYIRINTDESDQAVRNAQLIALQDSTGFRQKGLIVTFDLSHSGRQINNRLYPAWAQRDAADSWINPIRRPIIKDHKNGADNVIGRFISVEWESLEQKAVEHLGDIAAYIDVKRALDSNDPQRIYKTYTKYGLFEDKHWPGVGKLVAKALITDSDAIQKFMDGRYLTFSAGARTNALHCMLCGSAWHKGDICDHRPGIADEDGNTAYMMTGLYLGDEGSVVSNPADTESQVRNLELQDFDASSLKDSDSSSFFMNCDVTSFMLTDSTMEVASMNTIELKDLMELEPETLVDILAKGKVDIRLEDLTGETHTEIQWLIRIHDSLHSRYDYVIRGEYGESVDTIPTAIFALHGNIHDGSDQKGFRDSLINGELDGFDTKGTPSDAYKVARVSKDSDQELSLTKLKDDIMNVVETALESTRTDTAPEVKDEVATAIDSKPAEVVVQDSAGVRQAETQTEEKEEKEEPVTNTMLDQVKTLLATESQDSDAVVAALKGLLADAGPDFIEDDTIDWFILDMALQLRVGTPLTDEARAALPDKAFCGPNRTFPVSDAVHLTAAQKIIDRALLSTDQKAKVLACVNRKAKDIIIDSDTLCKCENCRCKQYDALNDDYVRALQQVDDSKTKLADVLEAHAKALEIEVSDTEATPRLDSLVGWFDNIKPTENTVVDSTNPLEHIKEVKNPSVSSSEGKEVSRKLGDFEKKIVTRYKTICDEEGQEQANQWFASQYKYLPATFDLTKYIN